MSLQNLYYVYRGRHYCPRGNSYFCKQLQSCKQSLKYESQPPGWHYIKKNYTVLYFLIAEICTLCSSHLKAPLIVKKSLLIQVSDVYLLDQFCINTPSPLSSPTLCPLANKCISQLYFLFRMDFETFYFFSRTSFFFFV